MQKGIRNGYGDVRY